jgi:hypothetical protein
MTLKSDIKLKAVIITGDTRYDKDLSSNQWATPIWKICTETMAQLSSEQYILSKGFKKVDE